jgi:DUF3039 family protein
MKGSDVTTTEVYRLQKTDNSHSDTDDTDGEVFHYVKKDKIMKSVVEGGHVVALCGEVFPVTKSPKAGSPVCGECKKIFERMKA